MPHAPLDTLRNKLYLANDAIKRINKQLHFTTSLRASILTQIEHIISHQPPSTKRYVEFESATRIFETNYWIHILDFQTRHNRDLSIEQTALLEADIYHFEETEERIPPDHREYSHYVHPSPPSSPDHTEAGTDLSTNI